MNIKNEDVWKKFVTLIYESINRQYCEFCRKHGFLNIIVIILVSVLTFYWVNVDMEESFTFTKGAIAVVFLIAIAYLSAEAVHWSVVMNKLRKVGNDIKDGFVYSPADVLKWAEVTGVYDKIINDNLLSLIACATITEVEAIKNGIRIGYWVNNESGVVEKGNYTLLSTKDISMLGDIIAESLRDCRAICS